MNLELKELDIDWPPDISVFKLKKYILSKLNTYGEPLRWAITSLTNHSEGIPQKISIEAVLIINEGQKKDINTDFNDNFYA